MKFFDKLMVVWLTMGLVFWMFFYIFLDSKANYLYMFVILLGFGLPFWLHRARLARLFLDWNLRPLIKFVVLGYSMVLLEEIFAGLFNNVAEGFSPQLFPIRVLQFWAFNVLAFTGFIFGWYFLMVKVGYSYREVFYLAGLFGIYSERIYPFVFSNVWVFFFYAPVVIFIYGFIISPALLSVRQPKKPLLPAVLRYPLAVLVIFVCSLGPVLLLSALRSSFPGAFPPASMIPL